MVTWVVVVAYASVAAELILLPVPSEVSSYRLARNDAPTQGRWRALRHLAPTAVVVLLFLTPLLATVVPAVRGWLLPLPLTLTPVGLATGVLLVVAGRALTTISVLQMRAALNDGNRGRLVYNGAFKLARHPGVSGIILMLVGLAVLTATAAAVAAVVAYVAHMNGRVRQEEADLLLRFGPRYRTFMRLVGRFAPRLRRRRHVPVALFASGTGSNVGALLQHRGTGGLAPAEPVCLIGNNSRVPVMTLAREHGLSTYHVSSRTDPDAQRHSARLQRILDRHAVELVVLAGYMKQLPADLVRRWRWRIVNIHPALLPRHGGAGMYGMAPHRAVIAAGERESGVTVHWVTEDYDAGPTVLQRTVAVAADDTAEDLAARVLALEHDTYWRAVSALAAAVAAGADLAGAPPLLSPAASAVT